MLVRVFRTTAVAFRVAGPSIELILFVTAMNKSSKQAKSGLSTIKRDFSTSSIGSAAPRSSQPLDWDPSPPRPAPPPKKKLTGSEARLLAIQEALAGLPKQPSPAPLGPSNTQNKRASPTGTQTVEPAPKRSRRILPPDWHDNDALSKPTLAAPIPNQSKSRSSSGSVLSPLVDSPSSSLSSASKTKVAPIFLSQEQTQILRLVQEGESLFYTGSAGELF